MSVKRSNRVLGMVLALTLVLMPASAMAAMWVGGQLGGNLMDNTNAGLSAAGLSATINDLRVEPSVIGGVTVGYDFIKEGFLGYDWPDWMKYFGVALDFTYNRMDIRGQSRTVTVGGVNIANVAIPKMEGYAAAWSFLVYAHYGFLPDSVVPSGRLHPYVMVGPACMLTGLNVNSGGLGARLGSSSQADVALVVEAGVRYFALKNVSLDTSFRYRYAEPSWNFNNSILGVPATIDARDFNSFSFLFRASYHF
jgi:opacity protein-like surface antigen